MNGLHDMGGVHGMGPIQAEKNEPVFHSRWEARVFAMVRAMGAWRKWNLDASRHQRELIPPAEYLRMSYYEKWLAALIELLVKSGLVTRSDVRSGMPAQGSPKAIPALTADKVRTLEAKGLPASRKVQVIPRFETGQRVRARNMHPLGHTRLPRYARGKVGTIERDHGVFVFPDSNAHMLGEKPRRSILSTSICGTTTLSRSDHIREPENLTALPPLPRDSGGPVFAEPWQAQAFALAIKLSEQEHFTWKEWAAALADELKAAASRGEPDDGSRYYQHWVAALERLLIAKGLTDPATLVARKEAWAEAYRRTPHGKPVELK